MDKQNYHKAYKKAYRSQMRFVTLTVSSADYARLAKAAKSENKKPTTLAHELVFTACDKALYVPAELKAQISELNFLMLNIANNVNQIAHWSNTLAQAPPYDKVLDHIRTLHEAIESYTQGRLKNRSPGASNSSSTNPT